MNDDEVINFVGRGVSDWRAIEDVTGVVELNVHLNRFSSLVGFPQGLKYLRVLNLSSNEFSSCDLPALSFIPTLASLDMAGNALTTLEDLPFMPGLVEASFAFN